MLCLFSLAIHGREKPLITQQAGIYTAVPSCSNRESVSYVSSDSSSSISSTIYLSFVRSLSSSLNKYLTGSFLCCMYSSTHTPIDLTRLQILNMKTFPPSTHGYYRDDDHQRFRFLFLVHLLLDRSVYYYNY